MGNERKVQIKLQMFLFKAREVTLNLPMSTIKTKETKLKKENHPSFSLAFLQESLQWKMDKRKKQTKAEQKRKQIDNMNKKEDEEMENRAPMVMVRHNREQ